MDTTTISALRSQFMSAINMLEAGIRACPDALWRARMWPVQDGPPDLAAYWYIAFHTLFWLDLYLTGTVDGFAPPAPFNMDELDPAGIVPAAPYSREQLLAYLAHGRAKCDAVVSALTEERAAAPTVFGRQRMNFLELLLDNMRHVQEHGAQLHMYLGQQAGHQQRWQGKTE